MQIEFQSPDHAHVTDYLLRWQNASGAQIQEQALPALQVGTVSGSSPLRYAVQSYQIIKPTGVATGASVTLSVTPRNAAGEGTAVFSAPFVLVALAVPGAVLGVTVTNPTV